MRGEALRVATAVDFSPVRARGYALFINVLCAPAEIDVDGVRVNESESESVNETLRVVSSDRPHSENCDFFHLYVVLIRCSLCSLAYDIKHLHQGELGTFLIRRG